MSRGKYPRTPEWRARMREIMLRRHQALQVVGAAERTVEAAEGPQRTQARKELAKARANVPERLRPDDFWAHFDAMWLGRTP